jgi:hypothetical protein
MTSKTIIQFGFEILMAMDYRIKIFSNIKPCNLVGKLSTYQTNMVSPFELPTLKTEAAHSHDQWYKSLGLHDILSQKPTCLPCGTNI